MADETIPDIITDPSGFDADGEFWLKAAQAAIRRTCGWHITPNIELSGVANSRGGKVIRLPARHVTSVDELTDSCLLYTSPSPRDRSLSRMPSSA